MTFGRDAAILRPAEAARHIDVGRRGPADELSPWVDYLWWVRWSTERPHVQRVIPQMCVHVAAEVAGARSSGPRLFAYGIMRDGFERTLTGTGHVIGITFRPGCFRPFLKSSVGALSGLGSLDPEVDPIANDIADLVATAERDKTIVRADQLASLAGVSVRTLQRQFSEYVGIGPKWVVQRCRLLDVAAHSDEPVDWSSLAIELGFSDQSHLTRSWTKLVGSPPARYVAGA